MEESLRWSDQVLLLKWVQLKKAIKGQVNGISIPTLNYAHLTIHLAKFDFTETKTTLCTCRFIPREEEG